ncbi:MAG: prepilin peptidase [Bryobacteraceae bacterium]|nr:prepilin peptidase [Bryobacteraceae bacterium]
MTIAIAALFGLLIGSFLNVCIYRLPRDLSVSHPSRSFCPACGATVAWYDNIPVLSWLMLAGKCRECGSRISARYPLIELFTALAFASAVWRYGETGEALRLAIFSAILIVLFFSDAECYILPDEFTLGGAAVGWALATLIPWRAGIVSLLLPFDRLPAGEALADALIGGALPAAMLWSLGGIYERVRGREGLGFGDVKMMLTLGAFMGLEGALLATIAGSLAGSLWGLARMAVKGRDAALDELPFGSFLAAAAFVIAHLGAHLGVTGRLY